MTEKEILFSVGKDDCKWEYFRCPGPGGQKVNKTSSGVRCKHPPSGAMGQATDTRSQHQNKVLAFERMANSKEFKEWHRVECARRTGKLDESKRNVDREMKNIKVEVKEDGKWVEVDKDDILRDKNETT